MPRERLEEFTAMTDKLTKACELIKDPPDVDFLCRSTEHKDDGEHTPVIEEHTAFLEVNFCLYFQEIVDVLNSRFSGKPINSGTVLGVSRRTYKRRLRSIKSAWNFGTGEN